MIRRLLLLVPILLAVSPAASPLPRETDYVIIDCYPIEPDGVDCRYRDSGVPYHLHALSI